MKLSVAIREGAKLRGQCFNGKYFEGGCSCAIGAAWEAWEIHGCEGPATDPRVDWALMEHRFPILRESISAKINPLQRRENVSTIVLQLNDKRRWTREAISEWVEKVERLLIAE